MSTFVCDNCGVMDNTALTLYWLKDQDAPARCSLCDPDIAKWHGCFERVEYDPERDAPINR